MKRSSVSLSVRLSLRPSLCPIDRQQQRRAAGLLLSALRARDIDRQLPAPHVRLNTDVNYVRFTFERIITFQKGLKVFHYNLVVKSASCHRQACERHLRTPFVL